MTARTWLFDVAPSGTTLTKTNTKADDGTESTSLNAGAGGTVTTSSEHAKQGLAAKFVTPVSTVANMRLPFSAGNKVAAVRFYHYVAAYKAIGSICNIRHGSGAAFRIGVSSTDKVILLDATGAIIETSVDSLVGARLNRFETTLSVDAQTATVNVYDDDSLVPYVTVAATGIDLGTTELVAVEFGTPGNNPGSTFTQWVDAATLDNGRATEIGPIVSEAAQLAPPVVSTTSTVPTASGAFDGEVTATWTDTGGATYDSCILAGNVSAGAVSTRNDSTRTRTFTGLPAGVHTVAVRAVP